MKLKLCTLSIIAVFLLSFNSVVAQHNEKFRHDFELLQQEKESRTPSQRKITSQLLQAIRESRGQQLADGVDLYPITVQVDNKGMVDVDISANITDAFLVKLEVAGAIIVYPSWQYHTVRIKAPFSIIEKIAAFDEVLSVSMGQTAMVAGSARPRIETAKYTAPVFSFMQAPGKKMTRTEMLRQKLERQLSHIQGFTGTVNSQGDATHGAVTVRNNYGFQGQGVRIGVLSDSYGSLTATAVSTDVSTGNLPGPGNPNGNLTPVGVIADAGGSDEGRAMLQIVHDLAPKAQLFFATANPTEAAFAANIQTLAAAPYNCNIIIDDVYYFDESPFQDGIVAQAVNTVTTSGVLYFSSAGNEGNVLRGSAGYYEADFNDVGSPTTFSVTGGTIHNFGTGLLGDVITTAGQAYALVWADAYGTSANDYDLYLVSTAGAIKGTSNTVQSGAANPYEQITPPALVAGDQLVVFKKTSAAVRAFAINTFRGILTTATTGQTHGHSSALNAFSVSATPAGTSADGTFPGPSTTPFVAANHVEYFTSDGPRRVFYNANGTLINGAPLFGTGTTGQLRLKPDITAADGVSTTLPGTSGLNPFYGTSAAAPHAGAIAALIKSGNPNITPAQMRTLLTGTALDIEGAGYDNTSGYGIVQALQAVQSFAPSPAASLFVNSSTITEGTTGTNGNGVVDPNENGKLVVVLANLTPVAATAVTGTLTSSTTGVAITQGTASFGTIAATTGTGTNSATPFTFTVNSSVACGTTITFTLTASFTGGTSPQSFPIYGTVGTSGTIINAVLGTAPPTGVDFATTSGTFSSNRITRSGQGSVCILAKAFPGVVASAVAKNYHAYTFTNTSSASECVSVNFAIGTVTGTGASIATAYVSVYGNAGFIPTNVSANYLADPGTSLQSNNFSFIAPAAQNFTVIVNDLLVNTNNSTYAYTLNVGLAKCQVNVLPLTWLDFTATEQNKQVALQWKVTNETNVTKYEVETSTDGSSFTKISAVAANSTSTSEKTYNALHVFPVAGYNYYRIKQIDIDGKYSYSKVNVIKIAGENNIVIAPNPATDFVTVQARSLIQRIQVFSVTGQLLNTVKPTGTDYHLPLTNLAAGQYLIRVETKTTVVNEKIIKQ